jgi:hypothetical protein|tara:strand:- start:119 stop:1090 length:972 start_codon:yes stop_codon:yes gene_type:complete
MKLVIADLNNRGIYRPLDEIYGEYETNDTGLCNRLLCWELVKIINHIHDDKFEIVLDVQQNPETNNCFTLEDTTMVNTSDINFDDYLPISDIMVQDIIDGKLKLGDKNYYTDFTKRQINDFIKNYSKRFIKSLKFKHNDINEDIKFVIQSSIGIHVRRGRGVKIHKDNTIDLNLFEGWNHDILSDYVRMKVKDMPAWKFYQFDFIKDEVYFEKIDLILKKLPKQKFYISHDLKDEYFERWVERYPDNIILKDTFYDLLSNWEIPLEVHTKNFLDLYCLCNTREIFKTPLSTWSDLACDYNNKIGVYLNWDSNQKILDKCIKKL